MGAYRFCQLTWDIGKAHPALFASLFHRICLIALGGVLLLSLRVMRFFRRIYPGMTIQPSRKQKSRLLQLFCDCGCRCSRIIHGSSFPLRESFSRGGELVTTVILGSACFPLGFVDSRNSLLNQRPREGTGHAYSSLPYLASQNRERFLYDQFT